MRITATIELDKPSQLTADGGWCSGTATVSVDPQDGGEPIAIEVESGGWVGYGVAIPESLRGTARAAGSLGGYGSLSDWQYSLSDNYLWHAGREGARWALDKISPEQEARMMRASGVDLDDEDAVDDWRGDLEIDVSDAIMDAQVNGLDAAEQEWLQELVFRAVCPRLWMARRAGVESSLEGIELPPAGGPDDVVRGEDVDDWHASETYLAEVRQAIVAGELVTEPVGEVDWLDRSVWYIVCIYGADGGDPGDSFTRWGRDDLGLWWADDGDEAVRCDQWGPYLTEAEARERAEQVAAARREPGSEDDVDAEAYLARTSASVQA